ncbi:hypothetical protein GQ53DRAFT_819035 [Thozetella sp. PMI_491]|nr:hypothetical protein GQ53DRAFT_819035 [Thozetella sp. PMI_491]
MDAWSTTGASAEHKVYTGFWTNWSQGRILGATLTITQSDGNLLIAFSALFITLVTSQLWRIVCVVVHRSYSRAEDKDDLYHQRQVIIRNSASPLNAAWEFARLSYCHRSIPDHSFRRLLPITVLALSCAGGFMTAAGFSSNLSSSVSNEVLLLPGSCGWVNFTAVLSANFSEAQTVVSPAFGTSVVNNANYARQCYVGDGEGSVDCTGYVQPRVPATVNRQAPCPFVANMCRSNSSNIIIDSGYIESNDVLGLNTPPDQRMLFRQVLHCAPIIADGYTSNFSSSSRNYTRYHYGNSTLLGQDGNFTTFDFMFQMTDLDFQYDLRQSLYQWPNYLLTTKTYIIANGKVDRGASQFVPIDSILRNDSDVSLFFLSGNGVWFTQPSDDPWYRARNKVFEQYSTTGSTSIPLYAFDEPASAMACVQQHQFCNPSLPDGKQCGPLASRFDALVRSAPLFRTNNGTFSRFKFITQNLYSGYFSLFNVLSALGPQTLSSQRSLQTGFQAPMDQDQWQQDVIGWWAVVMAGYQQKFVDLAMGSLDPRINKWIIGPEDEPQEDICKNQKINSTAYMSFSVFGLSFTLVTGVLIILVSLVIEPCLMYLHIRRGYAWYANIEWTANEVLELHRLAYRKEGPSTWKATKEEKPLSQRTGR